MEIIRLSVVSLSSRTLLIKLYIITSIISSINLFVFLSVINKTVRLLVSSLILVITSKGLTYL